MTAPFDYEKEEPAIDVPASYVAIRVTSLVAIALWSVIFGVFAGLILQEVF